MNLALNGFLCKINIKLASKLNTASTKCSFLIAHASNLKAHKIASKQIFPFTHDHRPLRNALPKQTPAPQVTEQSKTISLKARGPKHSINPFRASCHIRSVNPKFLHHARAAEKSQNRSASLDNERARASEVGRDIGVPFNLRDNRRLMSDLEKGREETNAASGGIKSRATGELEGVAGARLRGRRVSGGTKADKFRRVRSARVIYDRGKQLGRLYRAY